MTVSGGAENVKHQTKKWFILVLAMAMVFSMFTPAMTANAAFELEAESAILVDAESGKILYGKNIDAVLPTASMTKMMSEYLILEAINEGEISWDQEVPISDYVRELSLYVQLSNVPLRQDETYTVKELYESVAIYSANASTIALAELIAGSESAFVQRMNEKGEELGLEDFKFVNSSGLNNKDLLGNHPEGTDANAENVMSARATAKLAYNLLKDYPEVLETASIPEKTFRAGEGEEIEMENWNWMLKGIRPQHDYEGIDGLKTGYTAEAGNCFTGTAERNGMRLISVVMRTETRDDRFKETAKLLDYGFNNFTHTEVLPAGFQPAEAQTLPVSSGKEREVSISTSEPLHAVVRNGEEELYDPVVTIDESSLDEDGGLEAPVEAGQAVGQITLTYSGDGETAYLYEDQQGGATLVTDVDVERAGWFSLLMRGIGGFFSNVWSAAADTVRGWFS